ncbi:HNH endonuclease signature motif containing protein [Miltoncostaea oceani]|uniref:HNH endonuclease n=1 Tax=Miltoncostaea oceani TaxID=2843216 RepID=UPI0031BAA7B7
MEQTVGTPPTSRTHPLPEPPHEATPAGGLRRSMTPLLRPSGSTRAWRRRRAQILTRDGHRCSYCGGPATQVDHVIPRAVGGTDEPGNLVAACGPCNRRKGGRFFGSESQGHPDCPSSLPAGGSPRPTSRDW